MTEPRVWSSNSLDASVPGLVRAFHAELCRRYSGPHIRSSEINHRDPLCVRAYNVVVQYRETQEAQR